MLLSASTDKNNFCAKSNIYKMLPLKLNCHFSRVDLDQLVADAVQAAPKNSVDRAYWQAQKSQNLAGRGDMDFEVVPKQGPFGQ